MKKRKVRCLLGIGLCCLLLAALLVSSALAQPAGPYQVARGMISGGSYRLTTVNWQVTGDASGGSYRLLGPASPSSAGSGCCCTYLPCLMRDW
ncbi:MAG TPA: hypothetical protein PKO09_11695 [Anaerolineae bacterium]|nr:hypothetical protein [Anaerolineae bacterium]